MFEAHILTLLATTIAGQSEFSTSSQTLEFSEPMFRKTEIATLTYKNRLLRVWASNSNGYDIPTSKWQFRYDPLLIPMKDDQGQLVVTTEQFGDSWRTSFTLVLDDEAARKLAFDSVRQAYKNIEGLLPSNMFAIPVKSIAIRIPDLTSFHREVSLLGQQPCPPETACYPFHGPVSSFRVIVSSPSRKTADEVESLIPKCQIHFEITKISFRKQFPVTVPFQALRDSYFFTELRVKHSADYVSKFQLRRILKISRQQISSGRDLTAENAEGFDEGMLEQLWKRWTIASSDDFKPSMWNQTYNADKSRADVISNALNDIFVFDKRVEKFAMNFNRGKHDDLLLFSSDGYANKKFTEFELKRYLDYNGLRIDFRSNKIIVRTLDFVKIDWSELTDLNTLSQPFFTYLPFQFEKESGFMDFSSFRAKRSIWEYDSNGRIIQYRRDSKDLKERLSDNEDNVLGIFKRLEDLETSFKETRRKLEDGKDLKERLSKNEDKVFGIFSRLENIETSFRETRRKLEDSKDLKERLSNNEDKVFGIFTQLEGLENRFKNTSNIMNTNHSLLLNVSANITRRVQAFEKNINEVSVSTRNLSTSVEKLSMSSETRLKELSLTVTLLTTELRDKSVAFQLFETVFEIENWLCKPDWKLFCTSERCSCYKTNYVSMNWHQALDSCSRLGGDLASVHSYEESLFIRENSGEVWIGLNDATTEGSFKWSDGSPLYFTNWDPLMDKEKNEERDANDFVFISKVTGKWLVGKSLEGAGRELKSVCQEQINVEQIRSSENFMKELSMKWTNRQIQTLGKAIEHSVCKRGWKLYCDSTSCNCYFLEHVERSWIDALSNCQSLGSDLVSLHSYDEMSFFKELLSVERKKLVWIGLTKKGCEDKFTWSDGTPMDFLHWSPLEPGNKCYEHCGHTISDKWFSKSCMLDLCSVCKMKILTTT